MSEFARFRIRDEALPQSSTTSETIVRVATEKDLSEIAEIAADREGEPLENWQHSIRRSFESSAANLALLVVAGIQGRTAGFGKAGYFVPPNASPPNVAPEGWYLTGLVVRPAYRRQGHGSRLTIARLEWIADRADRLLFTSATAG